MAGAHKAVAAIICSEQRNGTTHDAMSEWRERLPTQDESESAHAELLLRD